MTYFINTLDDYWQYLKKYKPIYIKSKKTGQNILVPCANTLLVSTDLVVANSYNPNHVPTDKMNLLMDSIISNGFCFPVVCIFDEESEKFIIIDGFHRTTISSSEWLELEYIPLVVLSHDITQRMVATMQFNKAKGSHQVDLDAELIRSLIEQGLSDIEVAAKLRIDTDTVHRYKSLTGIAALFANTPYSTSWEMKEDNK